jgi:large subunit ribosomal protein L15
MQLNELKDNQGARKSRMRVGRGIGSGKGKTCGRGVKGQTSRSGVAINGFEGGQMPIYRRLPKRGFNNYTRLEFDTLTLRDVQVLVDNGTFKAGDTVTTEALKKAGVINNASNGVKLLVKGELKAKLSFDIERASKAAIAAVEKLGGTVAVKTRPRIPKRQTAKVAGREKSLIAFSSSRNIRGWFSSPFLYLVGLPSFTTRYMTRRSLPVSKPEQKRRSKFSDHVFGV